MKWFTAALIRLISFSLIWAGLSRANLDYLIYGFVAVPLATGLSLALLPPTSVSLRRLPGILWHSFTLALWFIKHSFIGGIDVARRALRRTVDVDPVVVSAPLTLPEGAPRHVALILMSLMPGTMVQRLVAEDGSTAHGPGAIADHIELHSLAAELEPARQWAELQRRCHKLVA